MLKAGDVEAWVETHPDSSWSDVIARFGKTRKHLRAMLRRRGREDLIGRLDEKDPKGYGHRLEYLLRSNPETTWSELEALFGRSRVQLRATMHARGAYNLLKGVRNE